MLNGIDKGIQAGHCAVEFFCNYNGPEDHPDLSDWAVHHKTFIVLSGGGHGELVEIEKFFDTKKNPFAWASFREDEVSLNSAMTCVGIILPERIYEAAQAVRMKTHDFEPKDNSFVLHMRPPRVGEPLPWSGREFSAWEVELIKLLNSCPLAK
jgi:hypothetical protein